jgi:cbb3-type cytochrome oxidase subunit 3
MLLHDSYFHPFNKSINTTHYDTITIAYSPLFHSTLTLIISIFGLIFNLICSIKIWFIIYQYKERKLNRNSQSEDSIHILSHHKYRFLLILTSNDFLLCLSSIISCLDEKYFYQSFLARHHLCAAQILIWKFTLHFIPLLIIVILCRYHSIIKKNFQINFSNLSTLNQLLCTDLCILISFVLALAWSVDGLWLWGIANIKDYIMLSSSVDENTYQNETNQIIKNSLNSSLIKSDEENDDRLYLPEQKLICYLQTNHNFNFTVRLVHLIQADFLLLFSLHLIGKFLLSKNKICNSLLFSII